MEKAPARGGGALPEGERRLFLKDETSWEPSETEKALPGGGGTLPEGEQRSFDKRVSRQEPAGVGDPETGHRFAELVATIYDAWWTHQVDTDGDGCYTGTLPGDFARLNWDPDVVGCSGSLLVYEKVYYKWADSQAWAFIDDTYPHTITDCAISDQQYIDMPMSAWCTLVDLKIEVYRYGQAVPDYARDPSNDVDLNDRLEEKTPEEAVRIYDAWWTYQVDSDGDGCYAGTLPGDWARLNWDPDVIGCSGVYLVFEKVYFKLASSPSWVLFYTTPEHLITDCAITDQQYVDIPMSPSCSTWDYKIEVYRENQNLPDDFRDPSSDGDLDNHREELAPELVATIYDAWWTSQMDTDADGCYAGILPGNYARLKWDPDVVGCSGSLLVFEKVYLRQTGSPNWALYYTSPSHWITDCPLDQEYVDIYMSPSCSLWDYKIEVYREGETSPDYTRDPTNDPDLRAHREESKQEDLHGEPDLIVWGDAADPFVSIETFPAGSCPVNKGCVEAGTRVLLRFTTEVRNVGDGDLVLGDPTESPQFEFDPCHGHYHFQGFADYRLKDQSGQIVAPGLKVGFCLSDVVRWDPNADQFEVYGCAYQGVQVGWSDVYDYTTDCQWVDITGVPNGSYRLEIEVNPDLLIEESDYSNNIASVPVEITSGAGVESPPETFTAFTVGACHPNPSSGGASISVGIPAAGGELRFEVFDSGGRLVAGPERRQLSGGQQSLYWDGRARGGHPAGSGVYSLVVRFGTERAVRKAVLLR